MSLPKKSSAAVTAALRLAALGDLRGAYAKRDLIYRHEAEAHAAGDLAGARILLEAAERLGPAIEAELEASRKRRAGDREAEGRRLRDEDRDARAPYDWMKTNHPPKPRRSKAEVYGERQFALTVEAARLLRAGRTLDETASVLLGSPLADGRDFDALHYVALIAQDNLGDPRLR